MPELVRVTGTVGGQGIARDLWSDAEDSQFVMVVTQSDMGLGDDEVNLIQEIAEENLRRLMTGFVTDGMLSGAQLLFTDQEMTPENNTFYVQRSILNLDHFPIYLADSRNVGGVLGLQQALKVVLPGPPSSTPRNDLVMLELWFEEVASPGQSNASTTVKERGGEANSNSPSGNDIQNTYLSIETSRRVQARWRIRVIEGALTPAGQVAWGGINPNNSSGLTYAALAGSSCVYRAGSVSGDAVRDQGTLTDANTLHTVNGFTYAIALAAIVRSPSVTVIAPAAVITGPPMAEIITRVPQSSIYPPLPNPFPGAPIYPQQFFYNGIVGDTTAGQGQAAQSLLSQNLATQFSIVQPGGIASNTGLLVRIEVELGRNSAGVGADVIAEVVVDASGQPHGAVISSFTIPKEWLQVAPRMISIPVGENILFGGKYWIRLRSGGNGNNFAVWGGETAASPTRSMSNTGAVSGTWSTTIPTLHAVFYIDPPAVNIFLLVPGATPQSGRSLIRNTIAGTEPGVVVRGYEYDTNLAMLMIEDATYDSSGNITEATLVSIGHDAIFGSIDTIQLIASR